MVACLGELAAAWPAQDPVADPAQDPETDPVQDPEQDPDKAADEAEQEPPAPATLERGIALISAGDYVQAATVLDEVTRAEPDNGRAWYNLGYALHQSADYAKSHTAYIRAASFKAYRVTAGYNHACNHAVQEEYEDALFVLRNVIDAGFVDIDLMRTDPELAGLRGDARFNAMLAEVSKAAATAPPKETDWVLYSLESIPAEHRFDFTIGEWDLLSEEGGDASVQRHVVTRIFDGAGVQRDIFDSEGQLRAKSIFVYAPQVKAWKHFWIDSEGRTAVLKGGLVETEMIMRQVTRNEEADSSVRIVYSRADTTSFVSRFEQTNDDGVTWETVATTRYVKRTE